MEILQSEMIAQIALNLIMMILILEALHLSVDALYDLQDHRQAVKIGNQDNLYELVVTMEIHAKDQPNCLLTIKKQGDLRKI